MKGLLIFTFFVAAMVLASCNGSENKEASKKLDETRKQTVENMSKIKNDIESRIKYVEEELQNATGELQELLTASRSELEAQRDAIASELEQVQVATLETWNDVVKKASEATAKAKTKTNEVSKIVRETLDKK